MNEPGALSEDVTGLRVAVANWRDPWHPQAGGAEVYAWEVAAGLAARGARVRYLTARARGQASRERRDGVGIVRLGGRFTLYPLVLGWLLARRWRFDAVVDCQNGIPFFTPLAVKRQTPVLLTVFHVHTAQFSLHFPGWLAGVGRFLEGPATRLVYRRHACVAISPSTVSGLRERLRWMGDVYLVGCGASPQAPALASAGRDRAASGGPAADRPALVWVGRLVVQKRAELIVPLAERLRGSGTVIEVVGRGPAAGALADAVRARGLQDVVRLRGYLGEDQKRALVGGALLHLSTSQGEGWGLSVLEAAALGVPTVAFDVDGLRDAVRDGETGWLVRDGQTLADVTLRALKELADPCRRAAMSAACRSWAGQLTWERSAGRMAALTRASVAKGTSRSGRPGAWIACYPGQPDPRGALVEGPVLDALLKQPPAGLALRPATPLERLLGRGAGPGDDLR